MRENVYGAIIEIISGILNVSPDVLEADTSIGDLETWDSLHHLRIIAKIEQIYGFKFTPDVMIDLEDIEDIVKATEDRI